MSGGGQRYFNTVFLEQVRLFMKTIGAKATAKILWNIDLAEQTNDPRLLRN